MAIRQFNGTWSKKQDRIDLRFNTTEGEEFSFWFTRFLTFKFVELVESVIADRLKEHYKNQRTADVVQEFQKEKIKKEADFDSTYLGGDKKPLGEDPILVVGISLTPSDSLVDVQLQTDRQQNVNFKVSQEMLMSLVLLLENLANSADWRLREGTPSEVVNADVTNPPDLPSNKLLH